MIVADEYYCGHISFEFVSSTNCLYHLFEAYGTNLMSCSQSHMHRTNHLEILCYQRKKEKLELQHALIWFERSANSILTGV